jgi:hypothetical protein
MVNVQFPNFSEKHVRKMAGKGEKITGMARPQPLAI